MTPRDAAIAVAVMLLWGLNFPIAKEGLDQLPPLAMVSLRFVIVAVLLVPFVRLPRAHLGRLAALSVTLGLVHFSLMFTALSHVDASVAAITIQIQVPFAAMLAAVFFKDKLGWRRALGMVVAIAGVAILAGEPREGSAWWAVLMVVGAAMMWAIANIQMKQLQDLDGLTINAYLGLFSAPLLAGASLILESGQAAAFAGADWRAWGAVAYQSVVVVILCYTLWYGLVRRHSVNVTMPFTLLVPLFGVAGGVALRGEPLTLNLLVGGAATVVGVGIIVLRRPKMFEKMPKET
ncbi:MAG: EamA family transporter [Alphaproteobacteria bacterium]|jgi:O-acetylserine/cysteine efflux transporter|nr:EamA family transporter [Alphaproteobacteria bacterium]